MSERLVSQYKRSLCKSRSWRHFNHSWSKIVISLTPSAMQSICFPLIVIIISCTLSRMEEPPLRDFFFVIKQLIHFASFINSSRLKNITSHKYSVSNYVLFSTDRSVYLKYSIKKMFARLLALWNVTIIETWLTVWIQQLN